MPSINWTWITSPDCPTAYPTGGSWTTTDTCPAGCSSVAPTGFPMDRCGPGTATTECNCDDCDTGDCGDEPPDADPGCCGPTVCEENETCCNETTCVLTSSFQTDSNNCGGCGNVCPPGYHCEAGACVIDGGDMGCCMTYTCTESGFVLTSSVTTSENCSTGSSSCCDPGNITCLGAEYKVWSMGACQPPTMGCCTSYGCNGGEWVAAFSFPSSTDCTAPATGPCDGSPEATGRFYYTWSPEPCPTEAQASYEAQIWDPRPCSGDPLTGEYSPNPWWFLSVACPEGYTSSPPDGLPTNPPPCEPYYFGMINPSVVGCCEGVVQRPCTAGGAGAMSYNPASQLAFKEEPCSQEECEAHVSTWMAEPSGEPNEEGLYKVKWILLDGCPGLCCSDQPTQPEFVKSSTLVDVPCKCGCD
jgi:hypothetical protein